MCPKFVVIECLLLFGDINFNQMSRNMKDTEILQVSNRYLLRVFNFRSSSRGTTCTKVWNQVEGQEK